MYLRLAVYVTVWSEHTTSLQSVSTAYVFVAITGFSTKNKCLEMEDKRYNK